QAAHEPADLGEASTPSVDELVDGGELGIEKRLTGDEPLNEQRPGKQGPPAVDDLVARPPVCPLGVDPQDDVGVVVHHRVGGDVDGEHGGELLDARDDPGAAVGEVPAAGMVLAAQEGAAHAARDAMIVGGGVERDEFPSCPGHGVVRCRISIREAYGAWWTLSMCGCPFPFLSMCGCPFPFVLFPRHDPLP